MATLDYTSVFRTTIGFDHLPMLIGLARQAERSGYPPAQPGSPGGLPGRPTCRIYLRRQVWVLEMVAASGGWIEPWHENGSVGGPSRPSELTFPTLAAATGYAKRHGFDYRIIAPVCRRRLGKHYRQRSCPGRGQDRQAH